MLFFMYGGKAMQYLHSLKRNHYYKGKLLTAEDFIMEQNYHLDKMNLHNTLYYDAGIIYGLQLNKQEDNILIVKAGVAQDGQGKMIIVSKDFYCKLEAIKGFQKEKQNCMHLYLQYVEKQMDSNYQALSEKQDHQEYNIDKESYLIFADSMYDRKSINSQFFLYDKLYEDDTIMIEQQIPKMIPEEGSFMLTVNVFNKKLNDQLNIGFQYLLDAPSLFQKDSNQLIIQIEDCELLQYHNCFKFKLYHKSQYLENSTSVDIRCSKIKIINNHTTKEFDISCHQELAICNDVKKTMIEQVRESVFISDDRIYLGSFYYEWINDYFKIIRVISASENDKQESERIFSIYHKIMDEYGLTSVDNETAENPIICGSIDIDEFTLKEDGMYISHWLKNPLGKGNAFIDVSVETNEKKQTMIHFGTLVDESVMLNIQYGVILDSQKGQFKILLKLPRSIKHKTIYVHYYISKVKKVNNEIGVSHLQSLEPSLITLFPKQTCQFTAVFDDARYKSEVSFHALDGGEIYENGYYVAPADEGVYHVCAIDTNGNKADSYVCVRKEKGMNHDGSS